MHRRTFTRSWTLGQWRSVALRILSMAVMAAVLQTQAALAATGDSEPATAPQRPSMAELCRGIEDPGRVVCADIGALDQTLVYNRFGSFNPFGMIFALDRDLAVLRPDAEQTESASDPVAVHPASAEPVSAEQCSAMTGAEHGHPREALSAGNVRLRDCKRPRPLVLRANVGDTLVVRVSNWLHAPRSPNFSSDICHGAATHDGAREAVVNQLSRGTASEVRHQEVSCASDNQQPEDEHGTPSLFPGPSDWPSTRAVNLVVQGLTPLPINGEIHPACIGSGAVAPDPVAPDQSFLCKYRLHQEGTYFFASQAAPAGGNGNGGSIVHGLFGALMVERAGSRAYRSQVSRATLDAVWPRAEDGPRHARTSLIDYERTWFEHLSTSGQPVEATDETLHTPLLNLSRVLDMPVSGTPDQPHYPNQRDYASAKRLEIVHSDLNAIIYCDSNSPGADCDDSRNSVAVSLEPTYTAFREFSVFFHDELKTFYTRNFEELGHFGQLAGVRDGFAINYGASGMGSLLLANRKGIGPASECMECMYEEFFLTSWANGDPALLEWYADDPSNVHHSYLNDPVVFRNFHAGPKETHVFHLHAHQWFAGNDPSRGSYLDSQTVAPQQGFTYNIYHGGLRGLRDEEDGWWDTQGSGNRNRTVGDSIFHCHLYPHFAQGMWALWRVHDVLEDGTRKLPDGQPTAELSTRFPSAEQRGHSRPGSIERLTGRWLGPAEGDPGSDYGTPIPALVPLPGEPLPLLPSYARAEDVDTSGELPALKATAPTPMPGFPFYVAGQPGHRPPQAPLDIARDLGEIEPGRDIINANADGNAAPAGIDTRVPGDGWLDGGIGRHVIIDGSRRELGFPLPDAIDRQLEHFDALDTDQKAALSTQLVAKAFALGDLSAHLSEARLQTLPNDGTRLERGAMGFHHNGQLYRATDLNPRLRLLDVTGAALADDASDGSYASLRAPLPDAVTAADIQPAAPQVAGFTVNGNPPRPGAPFADPCGATPLMRSQLPAGEDPLVPDDTIDYWPDPLLLGFRRYEVSAVQLDLVVNRAGWHDPQARINVLTEDSRRFKDQGSIKGQQAISPLTSDTEEPFFFRALSGECIEFRHTNELPRELELDDFQVKTPTDTIGQHIHLVKFDVTASDGSGNGWNYEDGTFAPDELASRRCASQGRVTAIEDATGISLAADECEAAVPSQTDIWRLPRQANRERFQTTVQRWFSDPILTLNGDAEDPQLRDRTLRTVFTHDHFGPSSIQQHGFYSALVIEPGLKATDGIQLPTEGDLEIAPEMESICGPAGVTGGNPDDDEDNESNTCVGLLPADRRLNQVAWSDQNWVGATRRVSLQGNDPTHPDYREFAIAVADFALLYDPRDRTSVDTLRQSAGLGANEEADNSDPPFSEGFGMSQIYCEARWRLSPWILDHKCGIDTTKEFAASSDLSRDSWYITGEHLPPAWLAGGTNRDDAHKPQYFGDLFLSYQPDSEEVTELFDHLVRWRQRAAGYLQPPADSVASLARPVAPPARPEAITTDHHDPYLVNYRGEPLALRIGDKTPNPEGDGHSEDCRPLAMGTPGQHASTLGESSLVPVSDVVTRLTRGRMPECSYTAQLTGDFGDMGTVLSSRYHSDPATPLLEAYQGERLVLRLIQGAQEVQHNFNVAGLAFKRNIDQAFPSGMRPLGLSPYRRSHPGVRDRCMGLGTAPGEPTPVALAGRPDEYRAWLDHPPGDPQAPTSPWWREFEALIANCDNMEGFVFSQEIGISEHFEMNGSLRADIPASVEMTETPALAALTSESRPSDSSDYLYNFGSVDSLWNGAWGLIRIYADDDTIDPATRVDWNADNPHPLRPLSPEGETIGTRLGTTLVSNESAGGNAEPPVVSSAGLTCPVPTGEAPQRVVDAVLAAVETRHVWPGGTDYGGGRYDPDGLMLALLSPAELDIQPFSGDSHDLVSRRAVLDAVKRRYHHGPQPMTLRVRAGDCVRLRYVNALTADASGGLRDRLGDARMPPIVGLNVDPPYQAPGHGKDDGRVIATPDATPHQPLGGVRPSAQLALSVALPGMDLLRDQPLAYGYAAAALPAGDVDKDEATVSRPLLFYAGRMRLDLGDGEREDLLNAIIQQITDALTAPSTSPLFEGRPLSADTDPALFLRTRNDPEEALFSLLGTHYQLVGQWGNQRLRCPDDARCFNRRASDFLAATSQRIARQLLSEKIHWIPYAFGAVPIRSTADVIAHAPHGLFGAIDVLPANWEPAADDGDDSDEDRWPQLRCAAPNDLNYQVCDAGWHADGLVGDPLAGGSADSMLYLVNNDAGVQNDAEGGATAEESPQRVREFVLYYQDGLNLWDDFSRIDWRWHDSGAPVREADGTRLRMVPDCLECDDSYDLGEQGVNYRSPAFSQILSRTSGVRVESSDDLNAIAFPDDYLLRHPQPIRLSACSGEQIVIRVIHPGGRARQRALVMNGYSYDDLFPGFGFPRSALLGPGKSLSAWLWPEARPGLALWHDGPTPIRAGGVWGWLEVDEENACRAAFQASTGSGASP